MSSGAFKKLMMHLQKDITVEFRNRYAVVVALAFALAAATLEGVVFGGFMRGEKVQSVVYWLTVFFASMNALPHLFIREEEEGTALLLRTYFNPSRVFGAKLLLTIALVMGVQVVFTPLYLGFLGIAVKGAGSFIMVGFTGGVAAACAAAFCGALASRARGRGALFAVLAVPAEIPVLVIASQGTMRALASARCTDHALFLLAYSAVLVAVSFLLIPAISSEE